MRHSIRRNQLSSLFISLILIVCFAYAARAQSALDGFDPNANNTVRVVVVQTDGKILIAGDFTTVAPNGGASVTRNRIARFNPDGTLDTAFNPNSSSNVFAIAVQSDGKILAGGFFSTIGGQTRNCIARLDAVTGLADSFNPNSNGTVFAIAVQTDGNILAGGAFISIGGQTRNGIARLDGATGLADSFNPNANSDIYAIAVQADGKILAGGFFTTIGGQTRNRIARLDAATGSADSFNPNANGSIFSIAVQADGKILAGGEFTGANSIGGQTRNRIARLSPVTGLSDSFNPNANSFVASIVAQPDGKILVGGAFSGAASIGGQFRNRIARLNPSTGLADSFDPNPNGGAVRAVAVQSDGKILAGGDFTTITPNGGAAVTRNRIARLETDGRADQTLDLGIPGSGSVVYATAVQPDGKILIGGNFSTVLGVTRNNIARLNSDGTLDTAFNPIASSIVFAIAVQADGKILVGGQFTSIGGQPRRSIARLDAATGLADSFDPNANSIVYSIAVQTDGKILVGGNSTVIGGQTRNYIARLDPATGLADSFNPNANSDVYAIAVQADGKILAGGSFTTIGGQTRNCIARLDAATGLADSFNPNANSSVTSIAVQADGKILAGGNFTTIGGQARNYMARLDPATGLADSFNPNTNGTVLTIAFQSDGKILVGGSFTTIGGQTRNRIARLDTTTGTADSFDPNATVTTVFSIAVQADGKILAGGGFTNIGGQPRNKFARLNNDTIAVQNLTVTQTAVNWTRSGSSPHLTRVTFEDSTDGVSYNFLGNGTAAGNNWTLGCLNLSTNQNIYIRARGFYRTGSYNGSESITESVRNAFIVPVPTITGTVTYGNAAAPPKYISNATVTGTGSPTVTTTTVAPGPCAGSYSLTGFGAGAYTVSLSKTTGQNGIGSADAARIAQHVSGALLFTNDRQRVTADVSGNGSISSNDAAFIARFVAGLGAPFGNTGQWRFFVAPGPTFPIGSSPTTRTYSSVTSSLTGEDYIGLLKGETTGNWAPSAARPAGGGVQKCGGPTVREGLTLDVECKALTNVRASTTFGPSRGIGVDLPDVGVEAGKEIVVPINVQGVADKGVISYEFDLRYDPSVMQPVGDGVDMKDTISRGLSVVTNATEPGLLRVVVYGAYPIDENGVLLNLRFTGVGGVGSISDLKFENLIFNEGEPMTVVNGELRIEN